MDLCIFVTLWLVFQNTVTYIYDNINLFCRNTTSIPYSMQCTRSIVSTVCSIKGTSHWLIGILGYIITKL